MVGAHAKALVFWMDNRYQSVQVQDQLHTDADVPFRFPLESGQGYTSRMSSHVTAKEISLIPFRKNIYPFQISFRTHRGSYGS